MIPCHQPHFDLSDLLAAVRREPAAAVFESEVADAVGARFGLLFSDGRVAFRAGLESLGIAGAEVVLPACICPSMAEAVIASGNRPVFADVHAEDFCLSAESLEEVLTPRTRVVVMAHMLGYRADVPAVRSRLAARKILLIEDYAQYLLPKERMAGLYSGDLAVLSFSRGKPICTISGGALVTNSREIHERARAFRRDRVAPSSPRVVARKFFWLAGAFVLKRRRIYASWQRFCRLAPTGSRTLAAHSADPRPSGYPPAPAEFQARLGVNQLSKLRRLSELRIQWARKLDESLRTGSGLRPAPILSEASFTRYPRLVPGRDEIGFCESMRSRGVIVGTTWQYALPFANACRHLAGGRPFPGAERIFREAVELPAYPGLTARDQARIIQAAKDSLAGAG